MILCTSNDVNPSHLAYLRTTLSREVVQSRVAQLDDAIKTDVEVLLTFGNYDDVVTEDDLRQLQGLRWIQSMSAGIEHLPLAYIRQCGILLTSAKGVQAGPISEYVMAMFLYAAKRLPSFQKSQQAAVWEGRINTGELFGSTVGVIGAGSIGSAVARKAQAFGMHVIGVNRSGRQMAGFDEMIPLADLTSILPRLDYVCAALPSTSQTRHLMGQATFDRMKPGVVFVNVGRGDVLVEADLIHALTSKRIAFAALDVFESEPLPAHHPFWSCDGIFITSHAASRTESYIPRVLELFAKNMGYFESNTCDHMHNRVM